MKIDGRGCETSEKSGVVEIVGVRYNESYKLELEDNK